MSEMDRKSIRCWGFNHNGTPKVYAEGLPEDPVLTADSARALAGALLRAADRAEIAVEKAVENESGEVLFEAPDA